MNEKINEQALAKLKGKLNSDVVSLSLRTTTPLNSEHFDQLRHWGGTLLYDSGIVAVVEIPAGRIEELAAWDTVLEII
ncbi:MAG TPA: hypothetical protein PLY87_20960 [Planctomycetaceae bacterium]|nr:hypothetical protein [Planctomycetaceae bacterium]HQZ67579.1 hypothetical protein [Planctomycetaceae bacterium]